MKKVIVSLLALCVVLCIAFSIELAKASPEAYSSKGSDYVSLSIIQPRNITYETSSIQVTISAQANPGIWYVGYSLDDKPFVEIAPQKWLAHTFNETFSLNGLSQGSHYLVAKANAPATPNDILTAYSNISFSISAKITPNPSTSPTSIPTNIPSPSPIVPEFSWLIILPLFLFMFSIAVTIKKRKN